MRRWYRGWILGLLIFSSLATAAEPPLTEAKVRKYMEARIESHRMQMEMKANADQYDDVVQAFFKKRDAMLRNRGWDIDDYEATRERVIYALEAMEQKEQLDARAPKREEERAKIQNNPHFTEEQKQQMLQGMEQMQAARMEQINKTKPDWPAVDPTGRS